LARATILTRGSARADFLDLYLAASLQVGVAFQTPRQAMQIIISDQAKGLADKKETAATLPSATADRCDSAFPRTGPYRWRIVSIFL
jgi:hypothetical protein